MPRYATIDIDSDAKGGIMVLVVWYGGIIQRENIIQP